MVRMQRRHKKRRLMGEINVVPYIDVMLVLLVIFMITAPLLTQGVKVDLPQTKSVPLNQIDNETVVVTVNRKGQYFIDDRPVNATELATRVAAIMRLRPQTPVYIRGDRNVAYNEVMKAMVLLQNAGVGNVGLITQAPDESPP